MAPIAFGIRLDPSFSAGRREAARRGSLQRSQHRSTRLHGPEIDPVVWIAYVIAFTAS